MKNRTIVIIIVIVVVLLIGIGVYTAYSNSRAPVVVTPNQTPVPVQNAGLLSTIADLLKGIFKKETLPPYVQVPPIDTEGCDATGKNKIGINCSIGGF